MYLTLLFNAKTTSLAFSQVNVINSIMTNDGADLYNGKL